MLACSVTAVLPPSKLWICRRIGSIGEGFEAWTLSGFLQISFGYFNYVMMLSFRDVQITFCFLQFNKESIWIFVLCWNYLFFMSFFFFYIYIRGNIHVNWKAQEARTLRNLWRILEELDKESTEQVWKKAWVGVGAERGWFGPRVDNWKRKVY